jgi:hypothetical protein
MRLRNTVWRSTGGIARGFPLCGFTTFLLFQRVYRPNSQCPCQPLCHAVNLFLAESERFPCRIRSVNGSCRAKFSTPAPCHLTHARSSFCAFAMGRFQPPCLRGDGVWSGDQIRSVRLEPSGAHLRTRPEQRVCRHGSPGQSRTYDTRKHLLGATAQTDGPILEDPPHFAC